VQGENSNDHHRFLNIWDNNLTVDESAWSWRVSLLATPSPRRPPRRSRTGVQEIAWRRTSPSCSGSETSTARSVWRLAVGSARKIRNTNCPNSYRFFYL
jgi:hypothetical protein